MEHKDQPGSLKWANMAAPAIGRRSPLVLVFFLVFTFTLFLQIFEPRNSPQTILVPFHLFSTSLIPSSGTINCFPTTQKPTQATSPFQALHEAHHYTLIAIKLSSPQFSVRRPIPPPACTAGPISFDWLHLGPILPPVLGLSVLYTFLVKFVTAFSGFLGFISSAAK
jgi:hypothetical protein